MMPWWGNMSSPEPLVSPNNPFAGFISQIDAISVDDVVGEARLGPGLSFGQARPPLQSIKDFVGQLRLLDGAGAPSRMIGRGTNACQEILNAVQQMRSLNAIALGGNPGLRGSLVQQLTSGYDNLVEATLPLLLYGNLHSSGINDAQARTYALLAEVEKQRDEVVSIVNETKELLAGQKKFTEEIAIGGYGTLFAKEARAHATAATVWLTVTGILAGLTAWAAWANYRASVALLDGFVRMPNSQVPNFPTALTVQFTIAKVILFTIGLSAAYWSARVYRSHRHNSIVNKHRANALTSFQEFVVNAKDPEVKNAVLLQTTSCIYAPQPTGFSSGSDTDGESPLKILEIVRNFQK